MSGQVEDRKKSNILIFSSFPGDSHPLGTPTGLSSQCARLSCGSQQPFLPPKSASKSTVKLREKFYLDQANLNSSSFILSLTGLEMGHTAT